MQVNELGEIMKRTKDTQQYGDLSKMGKEKKISADDDEKLSSSHLLPARINKANKKVGLIRTSQQLNFEMFVSLHSLGETMS